MEAQVRTAAICVICKCSVNSHEDHAIVKHDYAHLDCADVYDSRDEGGMDLPPFVTEVEEDEA